MRIGIIILLATLFSLYACDDLNQNDPKRQLFNNKMDLPETGSQTFGNITFKLSNLFEPYELKSFAYNQEALMLSIPALNLYFSVEQFKNESLNKFIDPQLGNFSTLDNLHNTYVIYRQKSFDTFVSSIAKDLKISSPNKAIVQVIQDGNEYSEELQLYLIATVSFNNEYYVFQFIGKKANMGYLYDDFLAIIKSIKAKA
jgi:hypothetical protein